MSLRIVNLALAGCVLSGSVFTLQAKDYAATEYRTEEDSELVRNSLENGSLVRVTIDNPYTPKGKPLYRANPEYYKQFTYQWVDEHTGQTVTSDITERATDRNQIVALLKKVYMDPDIPGYVEDISFIGNETKYDFYTNQTDLRKGANEAILPDGYYMAHTNGPDGRFNNTQVAMSRSEHNVIAYPLQDFFPFYVNNPVTPPLNGATALLVEMKASYYKMNEDTVTHKKSYPDPLGGITSNKTDEDLFAREIKALDYIDAVTLITRQRYLDEGGTNNTGFMFNMEGNFAKCFIVCKGSPRPDKATPAPTWYAGAQRHDDDNYILDRSGNIFKTRSGIIFYDMYEEFSPTNNGPMFDAYRDMNSGLRFEVDHNCSSIIGQQHDIIMGAEATYEQRNQKYHANLMFFLPDFRFADDTAYKPGTSKETLYSPYTFYSKDHRPYFFFNKITAEIDEPVDIITEKDNKIALIPVKWTSNYKKITDQQVPESFWIYRVIDGVVQPHFIPLDSIIIRQNKGEGIFTDERRFEDLTWTHTDSSIVRSYDTDVKVYVREPYDPANQSYQGKAITYVIRGVRMNSNFNTVESNIVTARLPYSEDGEYISIELLRAKSNYDIDREKNIYANTVNYVQLQANVDGKMKGIKEGNLLLGDLVKKVAVDENGSVITDASGNPERINVTSNGITNLDKFLHYGSFNIYRCWRDPSDPNNTLNIRKIMELPVDEHSVKIAGGSTPVFVVTEDDVRGRAIDLEWYKKRYNLDTTADELEPYRHIEDLRDEGLHLADGTVLPVKAAFSFKCSKDQILSDDYAQPWDPIGSNGKLMGYFIDDRDGNEEFTVSTFDNKFVQNYYYYMEFEHRDHETNPKVSNPVEVRVPLRPIAAGYFPYSLSDILNESEATFKNYDDIYDEGKLLPPNREGVSLQVSNSALIQYYDIYRLPRKTREAKRLVARAWRNGEGSFEPRVFDDYSENEESAIVRETTPPNFIGKIPFKLETEVNVGDRFAVVINTTSAADEPYRDNTYGAQFAIMPDLPRVEINRAKMKYIEDYKYEASVSVSPVFTEDTEHIYGDVSYGLWTFEHPEYKELGVYFPDEAVFTNKYHWIDAAMVLSDDVNESETELSYTFTHDRIAKPTKNDPVVTTNVVRMYAKINEPYRIDYIGANPEQEQYVIVDNVTHYGMFNASSTTGVEDIDADNSTNYTYYNLQGVKVDGNNLLPGIYIRTNGITSEKIMIQ